MFEGLFQPMHLLVILFIALLVFGPKRLPELGKGLGEGFRSLRNSMRERENETPTSTTPDANTVPEQKALTSSESKDSTT
ncbi:MAG: twin-arginine translocase TatA/TatE family subunit [Candidatus Korobacteraceae bacterium]